MATKVEMRIYGCRGLRFPEPYVQFETTQQTVTVPPSPQPKPKNPNPAFNKALYFDVANVVGGMMYVSVIDTNNVGQQAVLGRVDVPLSRLSAISNGVEVRNLYVLQTGGEVDIGLVPTHGVQSFATTPVIPDPVPVGSPAAIPADDEPVALSRAATVGPYQIPKKRQTQRGVYQYHPSDLQRIFPHLARGSFGVVFRGRCRGIEDLVVIKDMEIQNQNSIEEWRKEIAIMAQNKSPYIAEVFGFCSQGNVLTIVMEFMGLGDLFGVLHKKADKHPLSLIQRMRMSRHVALGIQVLHNNNIIHRDVKSMNVLVNQDYNCKVTDFGCSKVSNEFNVFNTVNTGTPLWMAPEVKTGNYSYPSDIYSLGLVLYELFERKLPMYDPNTQITTLPRQFQSSPVVLPCLNPNPAQRPVVSQVLEALEKLIRSVVSMAETKLSPEAQAQCHEAAQRQITEASSAGVAVSETEAESAAVFQYLLTLPMVEADIICGITAGPQTTPAAKPLSPQPAVDLHAPQFFTPTPVSPPSQKFEGYQHVHAQVVPRQEPEPAVAPAGSGHSAGSSHVSGGAVSPTPCNQTKHSNPLSLSKKHKPPCHPVGVKATDVIFVVIKSAKNLKAADSNGKSDPYCKVWINGYYSKTEIIRKTLNPTWEHTISVPVDPAVKEVRLQIEVWDWDRIGSHDFLGYIDMPAFDITVPTSKWIPVIPRSKKDKNITGEVLIEIKKSS